MIFFHPNHRGTFTTHLALEKSQCKNYFNWLRRSMTYQWPNCLILPQELLHRATHIFGTVKLPLEVSVKADIYDFVYVFICNILIKYGTITQNRQEKLYIKAKFHKMQQRQISGPSRLWRTYFPTITEVFVFVLGLELVFVCRMNRYRCRNSNNPLN